ncbi:hybrid sensor histidine kinase/response regulator [bacterium]|nr:hybrid sensor histidine kinase/response regulator [bacterium]
MPAGKTKSSRMRSINLIWISVTFAFIYWIIEAVRDTVLDESESLIGRIFITDVKVFWMRMLVVFIIMLFGTYAQSFRFKLQDGGKSTRKSFKNVRILMMGIAFSAGYWILEAFRDVFVYEKPSFWDQMVQLSVFDFWIRFLPVCMLLLFSSYAQIIFNRHEEVENALRVSNKKLTELDQLKSDFLNTVSHELRTPIAVMKEGVSLCMDNRVGTLNDVQRKLLTDTMANIERLNTLVTDLLDLSKIEAGKMKLHRYVFDVVPMLENIYSSYNPQARKKQIRLTWESNAPVVPLYADENKIIQVLNNLLNNAFRFTNAGGSIHIHARNHDTYIEFSVRDTGIGISEIDQKRLFSKFEQVERLNVSGYKGTGLGLSICKGLVEKHDGRIGVRSELGKGAVFFFTIPKLPFPKVMIVDDEKEILQTIRAILKKDHFETVEAEDGMTALRLAVETRPSLILLDMHLGKMNGYELIGRLKQDSRTTQIPLVIVSGHPVSQEKLEQTQVQQEIPVIQKPFKIDELRRTVRQAIAA